MGLLIFSLLFSVISAFVPSIAKCIISILYRNSKEDVILHKEAAYLKKEMDAISMIDEFAKHAKLQRKLLKVNDELKKRATSRLASSMKSRIILTYSLHTIMGLIILGTTWANRSVPVIVFPEKRLWPIASILSWPTGVPGGVSVAVWILLTNKVARASAVYLTSR